MASAARGSIVSATMSSAVAKVVALAFSGAVAVVTTHIILSQYGVAAYAQYGLLASLASLLPFADLGMSAVVLSAVSTSTDVRNDAELRAKLTSVLRVLLLSALVLMVAGGLVQSFGWWPSLLGGGLDSDRGGYVAFACIAVFAVTMPFGVGQRILIGLGRNHVQVLLSAVAAPLILLMALALPQAGPSAMQFVGALPYVAIMVVAIVTFAVAWRGVAPALGAAVRDVPRRRLVPGRPVMNLAWPSMVQLVAVPLSLQSDRVLLSHLGSTLQLATYGLAAQLFGLVLQTVNTAGISLWPIFARARADGHILAPYRASLGFAGAAAIVAGGLALLLPWIVPLVSDGRVRLELPLVMAFVAYVCVHAAKYPLGMYMNDLAGLRFQVLPIILMLPANVGLSVLLIPRFGAAGTVLASALTVLVFQVATSAWYVRRDLARRRAHLREVEGSQSSAPVR